MTIDPMTDDVRTSERTGGPAPAIVAVASPPGCGPRGIVRMSGPGCHQIVRAVDDRLEPVGAAHRVALARVRIPEGAVPALALLGDAPRTFTGEDTVELHLAGNPLLLDRLVDALLAAAEAIGVPARHATPGEFSARAFLNGRLALDRAEAIALAASAQRDDELRAARLLAEGCVGRAVAAWSDSALELLALVEAGIDFTDEDDVVAIAPVELATRATATADAIDRALAAALRPERLESAPTVVLVGPPNAGKSALFHALLGAERAVSTPIAGTTRDALSAPLCLDGPTGALTVTLVDVAGEETGRTASDGDELDRLARLAAHQATARADLLVRCVPPDAVAPPLPSAGPTSLTIRTKSDLLASRPAGDTGPRLAVSALTGAGIDELRRAIADELTGSGESIAGATMAVTARQDRLLRAASAALRDAAALGAGSTPRLASPELVAATLRLSLDRLGQISGRVVADDVLGAIFGRFCIGK